MRLICKYEQQVGLKIAVTSVQNLKKKKFSMVLLSLCPPAAYYDSSAGQVSSDNFRAATKANPDTSILSPEFTDGFWVCLR